MTDLCFTLGTDPLGWCHRHNRWLVDCRANADLQILRTEVQSLVRALDVMSERITKLEEKIVNMSLNPL